MILLVEKFPIFAGMCVGHFMYHLLNILKIKKKLFLLKTYTSFWGCSWKCLKIDIHPSKVPGSRLIFNVCTLLLGLLSTIIDMPVVDTFPYTFFSPSDCASHGIHITHFIIEISSSRNKNAHSLPVAELQKKTYRRRSRMGAHIYFYSMIFIPRIVYCCLS